MENNIETNDINVLAKSIFIKNLNYILNRLAIKENKSKISREEFAKRIHRSKSVVDKWFTGKLQRPSGPTLETLSNFVNENYILTEPIAPQDLMDTKLDSFAMMMHKTEDGKLKVTDFSMDYNEKDLLIMRALQKLSPEAKQHLLNFIIELTSQQ